MTSATLHTTDPVLVDFAGEIGAEDPVAIAGGRTRWHTGGELATGTREVRAPTGIVEYIPAEMIVRVRAGTEVDELHAALAEAGQRTALPDRGGTVGGAFAVGENDLNVLGRGTVRSSLLQVRYVSAEGRLINAGGPTVKNVTGFDVPRLMVGSLGTLGCLAETIVRTNPIPPASVWLSADDADPFEAFAALLAPSAVLWDGSSTWVLLEGHPPAIESESTVLAAYGSFAPAEGPPPLPAHRWSLRPADLRTLDRSETGDFVASVGVGTVHATEPQPREPLAPDVTTIAERLKSNFDPTGRLNPGRTPGAD